MSINSSSNSSINVSQCRELLALVNALHDVKIVGLGEAELKALLDAARRVQAGADALVWQIGAEADRLAERGQSAPADEFLTFGGHVRASTAKRDASRSRTINNVAGLREATSSGHISPDHLDSLARRFKNLTEEERNKIDESRLAEKATTLSADLFDRAVKNAVDRARTDHGLKDAQQKRSDSAFTHWFDNKTGMGKFSGQLDPERYEALTTTIDQHTSALAAIEGSSVAKNGNLAAEALVQLTCNSHKRSPNQPHITVVVDHETLAAGPNRHSIRETGNGHTIPPETNQRFACDAILQQATLDERGLPINVSRKYRTATNAQWVAIRAIYSGCAWDGCERPLSWCELHHIDEWQDGGKTNLNNLVPLCTTHHHRVHEGKWTIKLKPDRQLEIRKPNGRHHTTTDPPSRKLVATADTS